MIGGGMMVKAKLPQIVELDLRTMVEVAVETIRYTHNLPDGCYVHDGNIVYDEDVPGHHRDTERRILRKGATVEESAALLTIKMLKKVIIL